LKLFALLSLGIIASFLTKPAIASSCLDEVANFAIRICGDIATSGTSTIVDENGDIDSSISNIIKEVVGGSSSSINGHILYDTYVGVARDQLAGVYFSDIDCRQKMVNVAVAQVCRQTESSNSQVAVGSEILPRPEERTRASASSNTDNAPPRPGIRGRVATMPRIGPSFSVQPGLGEPARLIARELEAQFGRAGFAPDAQRPTIVYDVDADPIALGPVIDQPDHVIVKVTKRWTDATLRLPSRSVQAEYPWRNPNSSARNAAEQLFRLLLPSVRDEGLPERDGARK